MPAAGHVASAFLHTPENLPGFLMSNQKFEVATKPRLDTKVHPSLPEVCTCGARIDAAGDHLLNAKEAMHGIIPVNF